jgi:tetratricopeptide (TPR) repeat protein
MLTLGRVRDAQRQCMHVADPASRSGCSTLIAYAEGAVDRARRFLAPYFGHGGEAGTIIGVRLGLGNRARDVLATSRARDGSPETEAIDGEFAFASGDPGRAVDHLSMAVRAAPGQSWYFLAAETLANALVAAGRPQDAIQVLETAAAERAHAYDPFNGGPVCGYFWLRVRLLQAELYSQQGRLGDRDQILRELEQLLSRADSDFPILVRARELEQSSSRPAQR